jgi:hypothetical protein
MAEYSGWQVGSLSSIEPETNESLPPLRLFRQMVRVHWSPCPVDCQKGTLQPHGGRTTP